MNNIPSSIRELNTFGYMEHGYGNWLQLKEKEGQFGKFMSLESGITIAGKDEEGNVITDQKAMKWFTIPYDPKALREIANMCEAAAKAMENDGIMAKVPSEHF